ncbi:MAG: HEPN domain-containing protein [Candidatus Eisenbacteria bacterium]|nr:HEPN domain-containing protein [Candidatus Eisenbacteria bacterium]
MTNSGNTPGIEGTRVNRWADWWRQALRDLRHGRNALEDKDYEWAAFAAQQSAEKALKALVMNRGGEPWGHSVTNLVEALPQETPQEEEIVEAARRLDKHYIPTRYPNGFASGYPGKLYTRGEAEGALHDAETITEFCRRHLPE